MDFQAQVLESREWDTGTVVNDDVYREKQREQMRSRLSPFDQSILTAPGIDVSFSVPVPHAELYPKIFAENFTFEQ